MVFTKLNVPYELIFQEQEYMACPLLYCEYKKLFFPKKLVVVVVIGNVIFKGTKPLRCAHLTCPASPIPIRPDALD